MCHVSNGERKDCEVSCYRVARCESYKYLGILEADKLLQEKMKLNVSKEYIRRLR